MNYQITEEELNSVLKVLGDLPAKTSFNLIVMLHQLPRIEEKAEENVKQDNNEE